MARVSLKQCMACLRAKINIVSSSLASLATLNRGARALPRNKFVPRPNLVLYEYEGSPFCRRVRETLTLLDLHHEVRPTPRETLRSEGKFGVLSRYRGQIAHYPRAKMMFPFLVDHTAGIYLNESNAIVSHLWERYGDSVIGDHRSTFRLWYTNTENRRTVLLSTFFGQMLPGAASNLVVDYDMPRLLAASLLRPLPHMGTFVTPSKDIPENFLQLRLWGFEACPRSRLIREALSTLQLPYRMCTSGEGSPTRDELEHNNGSTVRSVPDSCSTRQ
mmetsp:Transcript_1563/g.3276  ORF Transcript_1563/g.3276 Transcript_1563/m.3276 type:complete len:275 (-) Transcript_1563:590-1414(-)